MQNFETFEANRFFKPVIVSGQISAGQISRPNCSSCPYDRLIHSQPGLSQKRRLIIYAFVADVAIKYNRRPLTAVCKQRKQPHFQRTLKPTQQSVSKNGFGQRNLKSNR